MLNDSSVDLNTQGSSTSAAPAIGKASRVLDVVAERAPIGLSDIARLTGLSKSTVHGIVNALVAEGFLQAGTRNKFYALGPSLMRLASRAQDRVLLDVASGAIQRFTAETGETAFFGRLDGERVVIWARSESDRPLNLSAAIGSAVPVMAGALGKAYLGSMEPAAARSRLQGVGLPAYTDRSMSSWTAYESAVDEAARLGYALDRGEYLPGIGAAAAAISWTNTIYFLWTVGIEAGYTDAQMEALGRAIRAAADGIVETLEGRGAQYERAV